MDKASATDNISEETTPRDYSNRTSLKRDRDSVEWQESMEEQLKALRAELEDQKAELRDQKEELAIRAEQSYQKDRQLSIHKKLWNDPEAGDRILDEDLADGDAIAAAYLYTSSMREDEHLLVEMYGLNAREITILERSNRFDSISVLDAWSTRVYGRRRLEVPAQVTEAFEKFLVVLRKDLKADPLIRGTELATAYYGFWKAHRSA